MRRSETVKRATIMEEHSGFKIKGQGFCLIYDHKPHCRGTQVWYKQADEGCYNYFILFINI